MPKGEVMPDLGIKRDAAERAMDVKGKIKQKSTKVSVTPGPIERLLLVSEVKAHIDRWMAIFGRDREGIHFNEFIWHVFSYKRFPSVSRGDAAALYAQQVAPEFVVISNNRREGFVTRNRPAACSWQDWLIFPPNLAWTMAFTHEDKWLGPFFAQNSKFESLDAENRKALCSAPET
ncbi:MAG: DUF4275 family protein [Rudaea sp.]|nr:DUF4275 family protein [Rudaea sp.]MBR0346358.1 DUF4275 family protein [Rudaea sp.]